MTKQELAAALALRAEISKTQASKAIDTLCDVITDTLKKGGDITLPGIGKLSVGKRAARAGRNPRTGEEIKIKACKVPKFSVSKTLKDAVN